MFKFCESGFFTGSMLALLLWEPASFGFGCCVLYAMITAILGLASSQTPLLLTRLESIVHGPVASAVSRQFAGLAHQTASQSLEVSQNLLRTLEQVLFCLVFWNATADSMHCVPKRNAVVLRCDEFPSPQISQKLRAFHRLQPVGPILGCLRD